MPLTATSKVRGAPGAARTARIWSAIPAGSSMSEPPGIDAPAAVHAQAVARDEVIVDQIKDGLCNVLRPALAPDQRGVDGLAPLLLRQIGRQEDRARHHAVDA